MSGSYRQQALKSKEKSRKKGIHKTDYSVYGFSMGEYIRYISEGLLIVIAFAYFFYRSTLAAFLLSPIVILYMKEKRRSLCKRRKEELSIQFKDALNSINSSLQAGYSLENAFSEAHRDMMEYHGPESIIAKELLFIKNGIRNNRILEELVEDLGDRSGVDDIRDLAQILKIGKQSGGNLGALLENNMDVMDEKLTVKQEIQTLISAKRLESNIMCVVPFFIILYVDFTSRGYFNAMYHTLAGRIMMTVCLLVYLAGFYLSRRIMEIEV